jgi:hypothetical protein
MTSKKKPYSQIYQKVVQNKQIQPKINPIP